MRRHPAFFLFSVLGLFLTSPSFAQVRYEGSPAAQKHALDAKLPTISLNPPNVEQLKKEDLVPKIGPLRYGVVLKTSIDLVSTGNLEAPSQDLLVTRLQIAAPGAKSLGLEFSRFDLPVGGKLFLYDAGLQNTLGAYDLRNRIPTTGEFVIEPFPGDSLIVEYSQPATLREMPSIVISGVIYDYRDVFELERGLNIPQANQTQATCNLVDVNCPEGAPYPLQKRSTVRTLYGGGLCSGSLINNTANDGTRYVYTANHCGQGTTTVFRFNYETSGCGTGSAPTNHNVSGATVLANDVDTDGRLLRITNAIPTSYNPYYAGWSRSTSNLTFGMSMNHPSGGPKKIAIDSNGGGQITANFVGIGNVKCWNMSFQTGGTLGGSSGGPLFDQNTRIRGALTGGPDNNCQISYFGRFYSFWNETTIAQYLDPTSSGVTTLDGFDPFGGPPVPPTITGITPSSVEAFLPAQVMITGTGFSSATSLDLGGTILTPPAGFTIVTDSAINLIPPTPTALGPLNVTVTNPNGTSNAMSLTYTDTNPPKLTADAFAFQGSQLNWTYGGGAGDTHFLIYALNSTTFPYNGFDILSGFNIILTQTLSPVGLGNLTITIPSGIGSLTLYSQGITFDGGGAGFVGASSVATTFIF